MTPWGNAQQIENIATGIRQVSSAGHGGIELSLERQRRLRELFPTWRSPYSPDGWLEEDCDWALAALAFPECFDARSCYWAIQTVRGGSVGYFAEPLAWLESKAGDSVRAKASNYTPPIPASAVYSDK